LHHGPRRAAHLLLPLRQNWRTDPRRSLQEIRAEISERSPRFLTFENTAFQGGDWAERLGTGKLGWGRVMPMVIGLVGAVGLLLGVLHGIEAAIWAAVYVLLGALDSPQDAIRYSVDSMTTRGASGLMLQQRWRLMGALEAADGMLLVWYQHCLHFCGNARVLANALRVPIKSRSTGPSHRFRLKSATLWGDGHELRAVADRWWAASLGRGVRHASGETADASGPRSSSSQARLRPERAPHTDSCGDQPLHSRGISVLGGGGRDHLANATRSPTSLSWFAWADRLRSHVS